MSTFRAVSSIEQTLSVYNQGLPTRFITKRQQTPSISAHLRSAKPFMPGYSYAPPGAGAAYMGMMGHLGPMRESRGPAPYGAASQGMYGGRPGYDTNRRYMQRLDPHPSDYRAPSNSPRGTSLFNSSASGSRGSQHSTRSPYESSYGLRSPYSSSSSPCSSGSSSYCNSAKSFMTDYKPRGGWFAGRRSGSDYPPFPGDFGSRGGVGRRGSFPRDAGVSKWSFGSW